MAWLAHLTRGTDRSRYPSARRTIAGLLAALILTACADQVVSESTQDDAPDALRQVATECESSSLRRLWLRWLQLPDSCAPAAPTTPTAPVTRPVTPTTPIQRPTSPVVEPVPTDSVDEPLISAVTLPPEQPWLPPPVGPVPSIPPLVRPEDDTTFPELGTGLIDVSHYDLDFAWDPASLLLDARATLTLTTRDALIGIPSTSATSSASMARASPSAAALRRRRCSVTCVTS